MFTPPIRRETKRIDGFKLSNSSKQRVIDLLYARANSRDKRNPTLAHYYDITDVKTGDKYMVFGDEAQKLLKNIGKSIDILNKQEFLKGFTKDIIISSTNGTVNINIDSNKPYNVFTQVKDNLTAVARVENETDSSFDIVLYDGEAYAEDKIKLDCSSNSVTVNYVVIYE